MIRVFYELLKEKTNISFKRVVAAILVAGFVLSYFPADLASVEAASGVASPSDSTGSGNQNGTEDSGELIGVGVGEGVEDEDNPLVSGDYEVESSTVETATEEDAYEIRSKGTTETYKPFNGMEEWRDRTEYEAPANTYCMTVATGATAGDKVLYFGVKYKDKDGVSRMQFIFPHLDATDRSKRLLKYYANNKDISDTYGKKIIQQLNYTKDEVATKALAAFTVQDIAFITEAEVKSIEYIDVYTEVGGWTIQGLSIYKVDKYKGYENYGVVSGESFLDFEGTLLADVYSNRSAQLTIPTTTQGTDAVTRITKDQTKELYIKTDFASTTDNKNSSSSKKTISSKKDYAAKESLYSLRVDFSDYYEGGLETFLNEKALAMNDKGNGIVEDMAIEIQYKDKHGWTRKTLLPVVLSSYATAMQTLGDKTILGFGQRGDTIAFQGYFPDMDKIMGEPIIYLGNAARTKLSEKGIKTLNATSAMSESISDTGSDDVRIAGISMYKGGCMPYITDGVDNDGATYEGATLQYMFEKGEPFMYQTTDQLRGRQILPGGSEKFKVVDYKSGNPIVAAQKSKNKFLVTLSTADLSKTTSADDLSLRLYYQTTDGEQANTPAYKAKESANDYMGIWPDVKGNNFIETSGLVAGGEITFLVEAPDFNYFTGADITIIGDNNWVMDNLKISYIQNYDSRLAYKKDVESAGVHSNYWIGRKAITAAFFNLKGTNYSIQGANDAGEQSVDGSGKVQLVVDGVPQFDENGDPIMVDYSDVETKQDSGNQIFKHGQTYKISFDSTTQEDVRETTYADVRYSMSYDQTQMDWGFCTEKKAYTVAVDVAADKNFDDGNGNSGSTNYFYFQLIFKNGKSGFVLANQQLSADGFRSGRTETFTIKINQDYGDLSGVRIIPEDLSEDADPFDKLNISSITVSEKTRGGSYISYLIPNVGWIDIDYRDELESASSHGQKARTADEMSKVYKVSGKQRNVKLLCEVEYGPLSDSSVDQFHGSVKAVVKYVSASDNEEHETTVDVVQEMANYLETSVKSVETTTDPDTNVQIVPPEGLGTYSDTTCMMRPNHTDRFFIPAIPDLKTIRSITFTAKHCGDETSEWNIGTVTISQVTKDGDLKLTDGDEYVRDVSKKYLCMNNNTKPIIEQLEVGDAKQIDTIEFTPNEIVWSSDEWATPVTRVPESTDDVVNIYVYPSASKYSDENTNPDDAEMDVSLKYKVPFSDYKKAPGNRMKHENDALGNEVYYQENISAADFSGAGKLTVFCPAEKLKIAYAIVQHFKEGVLIESYCYEFGGARAMDKPTATPSDNKKHIDDSCEKFAIAFGAGTETQNLVPEKKDVAIGFQYTSTIDDGRTVFQSPYVYLTDIGISQISEGLFAEIEYNVPCVKEVISYTIAGYGKLSGNIDAAACQVYKREVNQQWILDGTASQYNYNPRSYASFKDTYALTEIMTEHKVSAKNPYGEDSVTPVSLTFKTADASKTSDSSTRSAVKMKVKYPDCRGSNPSPEVTYEDITQYIQGSEKVFSAEYSEGQTVKFFLKEMSEDQQLTSLYIVPYNARVELDEDNEDIQLPDSEEDKSTAETIVDEAGNGEGVDLNNNASADLTQEILASRNAYWKIESLQIKVGFNGKVIDKPVDQSFSGLNTNNTLRMSDIKQILDVSVNDGSKTTVTTGQTFSVLAKADEKIKGTVFIVDSVNSARNAGFKVRAYRKVGDALEEVSSTLSDITTDGFVFTVPKNETNENVIYRIEVYPTDAPDLVDVIEVTVEGTGEADKATSTDAEEKKPD